MSRKNYNDNYVRETGRRLSERIIFHNGRVKKSHIFKHSVERQYKRPSPQEFSISGGNYHINKFHRKVVKSFKTLIICMYCNYGSKYFKIFNVCLFLIYSTLHIACGMFSWKISVFTSVFISLLSCLAKPIMFNLLYIFSVIKLHARINTNSRCFENQSVEKYQGCFDNRFLC